MIDARKLPAGTALAFALLNVAWWVLVFRVPPDKRSLEWGYLLFFGILPVGIPLALLDRALAAVNINLAQLLGSKGTPLSQNDYRAVIIGVVGWSAVGYAVGHWISGFLHGADSTPRWLIWATRGLALGVFGVVWGIVGSVHFGLFGLFTWPVIVLAGVVCLFISIYLLAQAGRRALTSRLSRPRP